MAWPFGRVDAVLRRGELVSSWTGYGALRIITRRWSNFDESHCRYNVLLARNRSESLFGNKAMRPIAEPPQSVFLKDDSKDVPSENLRFKVLFARVLIGFIVLICAEVFSGASLQVGLWHPWTVLVTYWLYFAHFFFLTTLAVRTGRTSLSSLYLWGILFGLYESWITKVIWHGYGGDGKFAMGHIGPYGFSELSMVFIYHPVVSFILPLVVACLLCPPLRCLFPSLAWFTGKSKGARAVQV